MGLDGLLGKMAEDSQEPASENPGSPVRARDLESGQWSVDHGAKIISVDKSYHAGTRVKLVIEGITDPVIVDPGQEFNVLASAPNS